MIKYNIKTFILYNFNILKGSLFITKEKYLRWWASLKSYTSCLVSKSHTLTDLSSETETRFLSSLVIAIETTPSKLKLIKFSAINA